MSKVARTFSVAADADSPSVDLTVQVDTFKSATPEARERMFEEGLRSITIKVQGTLRRRMAKGVRGAALAAEAQKVWDATVAGLRAERAPAVIIDAKALKLSKEQVAAMRAAGATVIND